MTELPNTRITKKQYVKEASLYIYHRTAAKKKEKKDLPEILSDSFVSYLKLLIYINLYNIKRRTYLH